MTREQNEPPLRVMVVDDSIVYRRILSMVVDRLPGATLVASAINGRAALEKLAQAPVDLILLDVEMPEMDGLATLKRIKAEHPSVHTVMVSGASKSNARITLQSLEAGALDFVAKPDSDDMEANAANLIQHIGRLLQLVRTKVTLAAARAAVPRSVQPPVPKAVPSRPPVGRAPQRAGCKDISLIAIGASTGGPNALATLVPSLPADLGIPVLIVQHMPPKFTGYLAERLDRDAPLQVREAEAGMPVEPGSVLIAPGGRHLVLAPRSPGQQRLPTVALCDDPPVQSCRPSVDVLFRSVAMHWSGGVLAVVLTGMGEDGADGVAALRERSAYCLTQSRESCVVYGMPRAVDVRGLSDEQVPLERLATRIAELSRRPQRVAVGAR